MGKNIIRLTESELKEIIKESVKKIIQESGDTLKGQYLYGKAARRQEKLGNKKRAEELNDYARKYNLLKEADKNLQGEDVREGLTAVISVKLTNPEFEGQTKTKLGNSEIRGLVESVMNEHFAAYLEENPAVSKSVLNECLTSALSFCCQ